MKIEGIIFFSPSLGCWSRADGVAVEPLFPCCDNSRQKKSSQKNPTKPKTQSPTKPPWLLQCKKMPFSVAIFSKNGAIFCSCNSSARFRRKHSQLPAQPPWHQHRITRNSMFFFRAWSSSELWYNLTPGTWAVPGIIINSGFWEAKAVWKLLQSGKSSPRAHLELLPAGRDAAFWASRTFPSCLF